MDVLADAVGCSMSFTLRAATEADAGPAARLLDTGLADRRPEMIVSLLGQGGLCLLAEQGGRLVGVGIGKVVPVVADLMPVGQKHLAAQINLQGPIADVESCVVLPGLRRAGIATTLLGESLKWMRSQGARSALASAWIYPDGRVPARRVLGAHGFVLDRTVERFWSAELIEQGYTCGQCGRPCSCSAALFIRRTLS